MELALQFENLNCEELCAIDGGKRNYSIEKYVKNYLDFIKCLKKNYYKEN